MDGGGAGGFRGEYERAMCPGTPRLRAGPARAEGRGYRKLMRQRCAHGCARGRWRLLSREAPPPLRHMHTSAHGGRPAPRGWRLAAAAVTSAVWGADAARCAIRRAGWLRPANANCQIALQPQARAPRGGGGTGSPVWKRGAGVWAPRGACCGWGGAWGARAQCAPLTFQGSSAAADAGVIMAAADDPLINGIEGVSRWLCTSTSGAAFGG
jgi:hypothetical protein